MMHTRQDDPLAHLSGVEVTDQGALKADWASSSLPDCFQKTLGKLPDAQNKAGNAFFKAYGALAGKPGLDLYNKAAVDHLSLGSAEQVFTLALALKQAGGISAADAYALANYAGGGVLYKGITGGLSPATPTASDFLNPSRLYDADSKQINMEAALLRLKKANPMVHNYMVDLIAAKAAKRAAQEAFVLGKDTKKVIDKQMEAAKKVAAAAGKAAEAGLNLATGAVEGAAGAFDFFAFVARNYIWFLGGGALLVGYLLYRNRETVGRAAVAYATGGTSEIARGLAK